MNRKHLFLAAFIILAVFLSGCNGVITPATDEAIVKNVINEYFLAINYQNWSKAKSCCLYGSDRYYATCVLEDYINSLYQYGVVTPTYIASISDVSIYGNYAQAYINFTLSVSVGSYYDIGSSSLYYYLQKIDNSWKIYGPGVTFKRVFLFNGNSPQENLEAFLEGEELTNRKKRHRMKNRAVLGVF